MAGCEICHGGVQFLAVKIIELNWGSFQPCLMTPGCFLRNVDDQIGFLCQSDTVTDLS